MPFLGVQSYEGVSYIIGGKTRKTCFGDNKTRPGNRIGKHNLAELIRMMFKRNKQRMVDVLKGEETPKQFDSAQLMQQIEEVRVRSGYEAKVAKRLKSRERGRAGRGGSI